MICLKTKESNIDKRNLLDASNKIHDDDGRAFGQRFVAFL